MSDQNRLSRRGFLKLAGMHLAALAFPAHSYKNTKSAIPRLKLTDLPIKIRAILQRVPVTSLDEEGFLWIHDPKGVLISRVPMAQTQWNRERSNPFERLFNDVSWGIVLHWFGAVLEGEDNLAAYLRGFDGLRRVEEYQTRTSAHFLVGDSVVDDRAAFERNEVGIVQTQKPDLDGTPFVTSHLHALDYEAHLQKQQYFVRAFYELGYREPGVRSILTDFFDGPRLDPNYRTIAVEMTGFAFDKPGHEPSEQQIANVISVIWALMKRYRIPVMNVLGHHEIELRKSDPGKNFISLIRYLLAIQALLTGDREMYALVFKSFNDRADSSWDAVYKYHKFIRDFFVLVGYPDQVYDLEAVVDYWGMQRFFRNQSNSSRASQEQSFGQMMLPLHQEAATKGDRFLEPGNHEGVDLFLAKNPNPFGPPGLVEVYLAADGECIFIGRGSVCANGKLAIFRHHQSDGAEVLTVYGHLEEVTGLQVGKFYTHGFCLGAIARGGSLGEGFLHFAVAYGATWDTVLKNNPVLPMDLKPDWIRRRYLSPLEYLKRWGALPITDEFPR